MLKNFTPFSAEQFLRFEEEFRSLPLTAIPNDHDFRPVPRGYAEINRLYHGGVFDGRRGPYVQLHKNPKSGDDARVLSELHFDFSLEIASLAEQYKIPHSGYSLCVQDRSFLTVKDEYEYYLLAQLLDGNLNSAMIGPGCVESYERTPLSFLVSNNPRGDQRYAYPIFTELAYREMWGRLLVTPLSELKGDPSPSHGFALLCDAIQRRIAPSSRDFTKLDRHSTSFEFMLMPSDFGEISKAIREVEFVGAYLSPVFSVVCDFDGDVQEYKVVFSRNRRFGQVSADAVNVATE